MIFTISPTQSDAQAVLRSFMLGVLPSGTDVIAGVVNRVPEPTNPNFVVMIPIRFERLATTRDDKGDVKFTGSTAADVLTVSNVAHGAIGLGNQLFGVNVADLTLITEQLSGPPGGAGTYRISKAQGLSTRTLAAGIISRVQNAEITVQLDFHTADNSASDMAQTVSTLLRDLYGTDFFRTQPAPFNAITPLYADDPRYMPFINENQQYEWRWTLDCCLQINQVVATPQQFADTAVIGLIEVDSHYPP